MATAFQAAIQVFFSYSHKDQHLRDKLETQLSFLKREELISTWHDRKIDPGTEWVGQIDSYLNKAQIILLLVSADFIASDYCYNIEVKQAMERHSLGEARVIPIILRPCDWQKTPFGKLPALPANGKPVTDRNWHNLDEAFFAVTEDIRKIVEEFNEGDQKLDDKQQRATHSDPLENLTLESSPKQSSTQPSLRLSSEKKIKQAYLDYIIFSNEKLELTGIPAYLFINAVTLEEIFIPLEFRRARPLSDYPLTEEEIEWYRKLQKQNELLDYPETKEAIEYYRELRKKQIPSEEMVRILLEAQNRSWQYIINRNDRISISELWQQLTSKQPVAIIQGYPGMGKSTLLKRIALHMAYCMLDRHDIITIQEPKKPLIPIILNLGDYAIEYKNFQSGSLSILKYLEMILKQLSSTIESIEKIFLRWLKRGQCLIMFDGLDEIIDLETRQKVQSAIKDFIFLQQTSSRNFGTNFNRVLITTRVAGYDQNAFYEYSQTHYIIAELTPRQIQEFLPRWCRNLVSTSQQVGEQLATAISEGEKIEKDVNLAISTRKEIRELAENPLLLTLLVLMRQNNIPLPRRRVELYSVITHVLLEDRNLVRGLPIIREEKAIQYLGPIAYQMQEARTILIRKRDVETSLRQVISPEEDDTNQLADAAAIFLELVRKRSGLFVLRTSNYFGFCHRTFQEYFIARYILHEIERAPTHWIPMFIQLARQPDDLWREPFLLAVAYQSGEDEFIVQQIIYQLLNDSKDIDQAHEHLLARAHDLMIARHYPVTLQFNEAETMPQPLPKNQLHDLLLAVECLIEAKFLTLNRALEKKIVAELLWAYREGRSDLITNAIGRWLKIQPEEVDRPTLAIVLSDILKDTQNSILQCTALETLIIIDQQIAGCSSKVLDILIPPLLALADLPAIGKYVPMPLPSKPDLDATDLALVALSSLGKRGPAGILLKDVQQYFKDNIRHLKLLARYSLECGILLTLSVVPLEEENYMRYKRAVQQWIVLRDRQRPSLLAEEDVEHCFNIHQDLLNCAEEVNYPSCLFVLEMLQLSSKYDDNLWRQTWQDFLSNKLTSSNNYVIKKSAALLWAMICPEDLVQKELANKIFQFENNRFIINYARKCLDTLRNDLENHQSLRNLFIWQNPNQVFDFKETIPRDDKRRKNDIVFQMKRAIASKTPRFAYRRDLRYLLYWEYYKVVKNA